MKLKHDQLPSSFLSIDVRRYFKKYGEVDTDDLGKRKRNEKAKVGRCRLTVSKFELNARLISALETKM